MVINIENVQHKYKDDIQSLLELINQEDNLGYSLTDQWLDYIIKHTSENIFIATHQGDLVGLATCMINEMDQTHGVINIVVHPRWRNKGIGSALHKQVIVYAKDKHVNHLEAYIKQRLQKSLKFAKNRGFKPVLYAWEMSQDLHKINLDLLAQDNPALIFRKARIKDGSSYAHIINQTFGDSLEPSVLEEMLKDPSVMVYILEQEGQAVGSLTIQIKSNLSTGYIYDVAITDQYRGQGLGSYMLRKAMKELQRQHITTASLTVTGGNKKALLLYKRLGFVEKDVDILGTVPV